MTQVNLSVPFQRVRHVAKYFNRVHLREGEVVRVKENLVKNNRVYVKEERGVLTRTVCNNSSSC